MQPTLDKPALQWQWRCVCQTSGFCRADAMWRRGIMSGWKKVCSLLDTYFWSIEAMEDSAKACHLCLDGLDYVWRGISQWMKKCGPFITFFFCYEAKSTYGGLIRLRSCLFPSLSWFQVLFLSFAPLKQYFAWVPTKSSVQKWNLLGNGCKYRITNDSLKQFWKRSKTK